MGNVAPPAREILHESTGLTIHRNPKNRFVVCTLYYYADPAKRSPEWASEARAGMTDAQWAKEYLIDATALFGEKCFPEISTNRAQIVVSAPYPEIDKDAQCWAGFDYGTRNPSSFHVYTKVDGCTYAIWELFEPCKNIAEFAAKLKACPYWDNIRYIACDPTIIRNRTQQTKAGLVSLATLFAQEGIHKLLAGSQDETSWMATMRDHWRNGNDPTFRIYDCCPNQIREFENAVFASLSERQQATGDQYSESIVTKDNHSLDDCKYFMNSTPKVVKTNVKVPDRWKQYLK